MAPTFLPLLFLFLFLFFAFHLPLCLSGESSAMESVPDLQNTMYKVIDGDPCVRLLNLSGPIGCANPGREKVLAPIVRFENVNGLSESSAILVSFDDFPSLFNRIPDDLSFASKVAGVLVKSRTDSQNNLKGFSPDQKFPQAQFAPYHNFSYEWNPSGLIALLAAVDALTHVHGLGDLSKQLVFAVFTGEAWGYLGSRRFLVELEINSDAIHGLNHSSIETVLELGSVGKGFNQGVKNFFAHKEGVSAPTDKTMTALKRAQESLLSENIKVTSASASNPGIPPSSLMTFSKKNPAISGVVLEDFDSVFVNKFYHSHLDDLSNVNSSAVVAAASLVARTLYILASESKDVEDSVLASINVNVSLVKQLMGCLLACDPGLSCELVNKYISPASTCPSHYVGVILDEPSSTPYPGYINDVPRFIWNFLADITSIPREHNNSSGCQQGCSRDEVCIKAETDGKGVCILSTTRYVPAYSTRLKYESGVWNVLPSNSSDIMGVVDPVWTESNWNSIGMRVYTVQNAAYDRIVLFGGIALTILSYLGVASSRALITKAMKRD